MTDAEWLACTDPQKMVEFLRDKSSSRKLRLFACACCRRVWHLMKDERSKEAVRVAERYADGFATKGELKAAASKAWKVEASKTARAAAEETTEGELKATWAAAGALAPGSVQAALHAATGAAVACACEAGKSWHVEHDRESCHQAALLRDIFNPRLPAIDLAVRAWSSGIVIKLAQTIYDDRAFDHLPILADALEEAGCSDPDILSHCRQPGEHVRGCWVVDLLLGKS